MTKLIGFKVTVIMNRTLYIEVPENATDEEISNKINSEIVLPQNALKIASEALNRMNIRIDKLDLKDWETSKFDIEPIK